MTVQGVGRARHTGEGPATAGLPEVGLQAASRSDESSTYGVRAVERTLDILSILARAPQGLLLGEVATKVGMPRSSVFRYLAVLESRQFVDRVGAGSAYRLGSAFLRFEEPMLSTLVAMARGPLERLRDQFGETVNLGALVGGRVVYLEVLESPRAVRLSARRGDREFIHSSALGKAVCAKLPDEDVRTLLSLEGMPQLTAATITDPDLLLKELSTVRQRGYATDMGESEEGAFCIAVSIDVATAPTQAAISYSCPITRFSEAEVPQIACSARTAADQIARAIDRSVP